MAAAVRFLRLARVPVTTNASRFLPFSRNSIRGQPYPPRSCMKGLEPVLENCVSRVSKLDIRKIYVSPGSMLKFGSIFSTSAIFGSVIFCPPVSYAMNGHDISMDGDVDALTIPDMEEQTPVVREVVNKFWVPAVFIVTILMNLHQPTILVARAITILLSTVPCRLSVHLFIEKFRQEAIIQHPQSYKLRRMYTKNVEVGGFFVFSLAKVETVDRDLALIGILGSWWVLPQSTFHGVGCLIRTAATLFE